MPNITPPTTPKLTEDQRGRVQVLFFYIAVAFASNNWDPWRFIR